MSPIAQVGRNVPVAHQHVTRLAVLAHDRHGPGAVGLDRTREERLVAAAVEHRAGVVAHTAVDRHVRADVGEVLDRAHGVERDRRGRDDRSARLGGDRGRRCRTPRTRGGWRCPTG